MALFPRKIRGKYAMLSRQGGENNMIMFSDNLYLWEKAQILQKPMFPYEFIQMGNCGSPIETPEGWLVLTHGVGPMRTYSIGIELLDLEDPTRIISRIDEPILMPNEHDREGYVPNVVYSCGAIIYQDETGIEDARFVRFVDEDGTATYYATYTAYNGETILPHLIETGDFLSFKITTLNGTQAQDKGMALFPRKIRGKYAMLSRQGGENNMIMFSDNLYLWEKAQILQKPMFPYEFIQMGNCGSPIETPEGWLVLTHGVGPMRTYSIGIELLDLEDPTRIISRIDEPILMPNEHDREGYVPNVVYSCGAIIYQDELIIPYASADQRCGIATLPVPPVMARLAQSRNPITKFSFKKVTRFPSGSSSPSRNPSVRGLRMPVSCVSLMRTAPRPTTPPIPRTTERRSYRTSLRLETSSHLRLRP